MGNSQSFNSQSFNPHECLKFDRIIDGENQIYVGVIGSPNKSNPYSSQGMRIGIDGRLHRLENFIETSNSLTYEFDSNTTLCVTKRNGEILLNIKEPETSTHIIKPMDRINVDFFKPIKFSNLSTEIDKLNDFIKPN